VAAGGLDLSARRIRVRMTLSVALTRDHLTMAALLKAIVCLSSSGLARQKPAEVHLWLVRP
jgi:hypothetical protein